MSVIPLTILCSVALAGLFAVLFLLSRRGGAAGRPEQNSLLPFEEEGSRGAGGAHAGGSQDIRTDHERANQDH